MKKMSLVFVLILSVFTLTGCDIFEKEQEHSHNLEELQSLELNYRVRVDFEREDYSVIVVADVTGDEVLVREELQDGTITDEDKEEYSLSEVDFTEEYYYFMLPFLLIEEEDLTEDYSTFKEGVVNDFFLRPIEEDNYSDVLEELEELEISYTFIWEDGKLVGFTMSSNEYVNLEATIEYK